MTQRANRSGQVLLIGVLLILLLLVSIPAIIFMNQAGGRHGVTAQKRLRGRAIAEEGIAYAIQQLSVPGDPVLGTPPPNWPPLNGGACPIIWNNTSFLSAQGKGSFTLQCVAGQPFPYQVTVKATPFDDQGNVIGGSSIQAILSQRTLGAKLPSGLNVPAALEVMHAPDSTGGGQLSITNGPIVCHDSNLWTLDPVSDQSQNPRKFSEGGIKGATFPRSEPSATNLATDQKEYWAYTSLGFASTIDKIFYAADSKKTDLTTATNMPICAKVGATYGNIISPDGALTPGPCAPGVATCGYFAAVANCPNGDVALFGPTAANSFTYTCPAAAPNCTIFVNGPALIRFSAINMTAGSPSGAVVVDGTLQLADNAVPNVMTTAAYCPPDNCLDFPFNPSHALCPSMGFGAYCGSGTSRPIGLKGFLYASGDLKLLKPTTPWYYWTVEGVIRVDGILRLPYAALVVNYNDFVNHYIHTTNFELEIDGTTAVP